MQSSKLGRVAVTSALLLGAFSANAQSLDKVFSNFSACDSGFFKAIATDKTALGAVAPIEGNDLVAWISTKDRKAADGNVLPLQGAPTVAGLPNTNPAAVHVMPT